MFFSTTNSNGFQHLPKKDSSSTPLVKQQPTNPWIIHHKLRKLSQKPIYGTEYIAYSVHYSTSPP